MWLLVHKCLLHHRRHKLCACPHRAALRQRPPQRRLALLVAAQHDRRGDICAAAAGICVYGCRQVVGNVYEDARAAEGGAGDEAEASAAVAFACEKRRRDAACAACNFRTDIKTLRSCGRLQDDNSECVLCSVTPTPPANIRPKGNAQGMCTTRQL